MIYFDNASTSFPKPPEVSQAINQLITEFAVNPGRGAYPLADQAAALVSVTRGKLAALIGAEDPNHVIFTQNATQSLNTVIKGFLKPGDHVLICSFSHNAVIRSLEKLKRSGRITYDVFQLDSEGNVDSGQFLAAINENTRLVVCNHASNVIGVIASLSKLADICRQRRIAFMLDCTQSLGYAPLDVVKLPIDFLAGTGHKSLLGPTGIGFLYVKNPETLDSLIEGGSPGNHSISPVHPLIMPFKLEAGTLNTVGIAGLNGALDYIQRVPLGRIREISMSLTEYAWTQLQEINEITLYGTENMNKKVPIISFNIAGSLPSEVAFKYGENHKLCLRAGLHCAPLIHKFLKTLPNGTLRISFSHFNNRDEIDRLIFATKEIICRLK